MSEPINPYESPGTPPERGRPKWLGFVLYFLGFLLVPVLLWMIFGKFEIRR